MLDLASLRITRVTVGQGVWMGNDTLLVEAPPATATGQRPSLDSGSRTAAFCAMGRRCVITPVGTKGQSTPLGRTTSP